MTDDDKSLGDDATLGGESPEQEVDAQSLGDQSTHGDHSQMDSVGDSSSLGDQLTFGGDESGAALDDGMEIVDLESRYTIERVLGKGGMGEVLLATDTRLERKVAIKRILGKAARSKTAVNRFLTEAKAVAALNHTNIVQIHDYGRDKQGPFLIMEYVAGESLLERCQQGAIALEESIDLIVQLCDGLAAAHDAHIVHRDVKPANILLTKNNIPKLTDFGLAKTETADTGMTMAGAVLGTLDFMPPEQCKDAALVDARSDLWSLAASLYQMVTGEPPRVIDLDAVPRELRTCLAKALKTNKEDRHQSAREFRDALLASQSGTAETHLAEGDCPHCGTKNPTTRKFCRNPDCGESLEVPCLSCISKIPMWEEVCDNCGAKQRELLEPRRTQMVSEQAEAESLLKGLEFDRAQSVAVALRDEPDLRLMHLKGWADGFLSQLETARQQELERVSSLMDEAIKHQQAHDYAAGIRTLDSVPAIMGNTVVPGHDLRVHELQNHLQSTLEEIERLDKLIRKRVKNRELNGLLAEVKQLQALQPGREKLEKLADQLIERDQKLAATRDEALAAARQYLADQDYGQSLAQLNQIDTSLVNPEIETLIQTATTKHDQLKELRDSIRNALQSKQTHGLLPQVEQCLTLQSDAEDLQKLRDQLVERDSRNEAMVAQVIQQAEQMRDACRFDEAVRELGQISDVELTSETFAGLADLSTECENLKSLRSGAIKAFESASETGDFKKVSVSLQHYQDALLASGVVDPDVARTTADCKKRLAAQLAAEQAAEQEAQRQQALKLKRLRRYVIGVAAVMLTIVIGIVIWQVQAAIRAQAIASALKTGDYATVLEMDSDNTEALAMKREADIKQALAKGDYATVLEMEAKSIKTGMQTLTHPSNVLSIAFSPDGKTLASADGWNDTIRLWDAKSGKEISTFEGHAGVNVVAFSPDGKTLASGSYYDGSIKLWDAQSGRPRGGFTIKDGPTYSTSSVAFSPDGKTLASGFEDGTIKLWDAKSKKAIGPIKGHTSAVNSVAFSPDGKTLASGSADKTIKLWDAQTGKELTTLTGHTSNVNSVAFSPDGQRIASGSRDETIRLWDAESGKEISTFKGHTNGVNVVAFSPDGKTLASGSYDQTIKLWDVGEHLEALERIKKKYANPSD